MAFATTAQKNTVRQLLKRAEFDERTITFQYRSLKLNEAWIGQPVDSWVDSLTTESASAAIGSLKSLA